jgi:hypothetical protein
MKGFYERAGKDVATATWEKGPSWLSSIIEESTILVAVLAIGGLTAGLVLGFQNVVYHPLKVVGGLSWDVFLATFAVNTLIGYGVKKGPSRSAFAAMPPEAQEVAKKARRKKAKAAASRRNLALLLCLIVAGLRHQFGSVRAAVNAAAVALNFPDPEL